MVQTRVNAHSEKHPGSDASPTGASLWQGQKVVVTGATGFVGTNLAPWLKRLPCTVVTLSRRDYDLTEQSQVRRLFADHRPDIVFHLAGLVGGIDVNRARPADFCYENLIMGAMMLHESWRAGVRKYITLMGGCSYPAKAPSPIREAELFNGMPQAENAPYSLAKAMSVILAQSYRRQKGFNAIVLVPGNLYGPFDNFDANTSHVVPALVRKFADAKLAGQTQVVAWGSGRPTRDFVFIGDVCEVLVHAAIRYNGSDIINVASGRVVTIRELTQIIAELVGYQGEVVWDNSKPDGQLYKGLDTSRLREILGCECRTSLRDGLHQTIQWYLSKPPGLRV
jgi:GDP-L-fucose synthase